MFWRYLDKGHPALAAGPAEMSAAVIEDLFVQHGRNDRPRPGGHEPRRARLFVMSDHGFKPFRRGVNLNTWLLRERLPGPQGRR